MIQATDLPAPRTTCPVCGSEKKVAEALFKGKVKEEDLPKACFLIANMNPQPSGMLVALPLAVDMSATPITTRVAVAHWDICLDCGAPYVKSWELQSVPPPSLRHPR